MPTYDCRLLSQDDLDEDLDENVNAADEHQAANMFRLRVQGLKRGPAEISVFSPNGTWTVFDWDLKVVKEEKPPRE